jgi:hypothetical protein
MKLVEPLLCIAGLRESQKPQWIAGSTALLRYREGLSEDYCSGNEPHFLAQEIQELVFCARN